MVVIALYCVLVVIVLYCVCDPLGSAQFRPVQPSSAQCSLVDVIVFRPVFSPVPASSAQFRPVQPRGACLDSMQDIVLVVVVLVAAPVAL